ncbi:F-box/kelch-repeat protein At3g23880-like [Silene latifolia]|uniref:F-box/kelch-repeat protein At3g23880-like n=1 Tax=Silene latifolia TaxID=37657 RepID=UPI003D771F63
MEGRKKKKKVSKLKDLSTNLPPELCIDHILPALPVKTLLQFRSVCKLWRDTIDDPRFVSIHFTLSKNNVDKKKVIAIENFGVLHKKRHKLTIRHGKTLRKQTDLFQHPYRYYFQGSCNGLFFVVGWQQLKLWNPSIRKSMSIPPCPLDPHFRYRKYFFGFRPSSNDYAVYAFQSDKSSRMNVSVAVYTLSDNLWNIRSCKLSLPPDYNIDYDSFDPYSVLMCGGKAVFHDGVLHWFNTGYGNKTHLISFDFDVEKFSGLELPDNRHAQAWTTFRFLFVLGKLLALFSISSEHSSIWVLKNESWDLLFSTTSSSVRYDYINEHPDVVTKVAFYAEDGGVTLVYGKVGYKIMSDEIQELNKTMSPKLIIDTYTESLVLYKGCQGQCLSILLYIDFRFRVQNLSGIASTPDMTVVSDTLRKQSDLLHSTEIPFSSEAATACFPG